MKPYSHFLEFSRRLEEIQAKNDPEEFTTWSKAKASKFANEVWTNINERNLTDNILPYKQRARLILQKNADHSVQKVFLRKL